MRPTAVRAMGDDTQTSSTLLRHVAETGNETACRQFVDRYGSLVRGVGRACGLPPEGAEDLTQEVMAVAVTALREHRYDRQRGRFKKWLKGVISHKIAHLRAAARRRPERALGPWPVAGAPGSVATPDLIDPHPEPAEEFEAEFERQWQQTVFEDALDEVRLEVEPATFQAFDLYARKNRPAGEVARLLGMSRSAVYQAKARVLARVRETIGLSDGA